MAWNNEWEIPAGEWTPDWYYTYNVRQTKKIVFDKSFADARPTSLYYWFNNFNNLETIEGIENLNASEAINMSYMFRNCYALKKIDLSKVNAEKVTNINGIVSGCTALEELDLSGISTENVTSSYYQMFANMNALKKINLSGWSNDNITNMYRMFYNDAALEEVNLTGFGTANVNSMYEMFSNCPELKTLDLSSFDLSNVNNMVRFLSGDAKLETVKFADNLNTESLSNTAALFENCAALKTIDLSKFNTQRVWDMNHMFAGCAALEELDLSTLNTQSVSYMYNMFDGCAKLKELDIVSFDVSSLGSMDYMFANCDLLETVYVSREFYNRGGGNNMFFNCPKIKNPKVAENIYDENIVSYQTAIDRYCGIAEVYYPGTVNAGKYMTYYINNDVQLVNGSAEGLKLATVTGINDTEVVAKEITIAASETPLLIYNGGDEAQNVKLVSAYKSSDKVDDVKPYAGFQGTLNGQQMAGSSDDLDYYICNGEDFVWVMNSGSVYANRCWLEIDKKLADAQGAQRRAIVWGDSETTGISIATAEAEQNGNYYDLNGRQMQGKPAQKGLYILNGKKVVIK
jgi:surface protein